MIIVVDIICAAVSLMAVGFALGFLAGKLTGNTQLTVTGAEEAIRAIGIIGARGTALKMHQMGIRFTTKSTVDGFTLHDLGLESLAVDQRATGELLN